MSTSTTPGPPVTSQPPRTPWPLSYVLPPMGALPTAPRAARAHVSDILGQWGLPYFEDTAILVTSELVTNAVQQCHHASGKPAYIGGRLPVVQLSLFSDRARLLITVYDQAPGIPAERHPDHSAETGRGLALIAALGQWDWHPVHGGKIVRAILAAAT
ncbi:MAG: putative anti-sigma regulatory factor, serine/threonine protein kinase [Actinomycetia bacterium]|nr:putative anti-sigma regulatory factor, serine/threonine protein kinase [Actinomycetes bacterium]